MINYYLVQALFSSDFQDMTKMFFWSFREDLKKIEILFETLPINP